MRTTRLLIASLILTAALAACFGLPKPKYHSLNILDKLSIPYTFADWKSADASGSFDLTDDRYRFISSIFARIYERRDGANLMLLILDAGNFHNPKACFASSGYTVTELPDTTVSLGKRSFSAPTLLMSRPQENTMLIYWLCLDKKITSWTGQKVKEFWSSLIGKKKAGLMVRLDIPLPSGKTEQASLIASQFLADLFANLDAEQKEYLFGR